VPPFHCEHIRTMKGTKDHAGSHIYMEMFLLDEVQWYTIASMSKNDGTILDVLPGPAAYEAGFGPRMKIVSVDGRAYSKHCAGRISERIPGAKDYLTEILKPRSAK
jgi:hypothetical protein